MKHTWKWQRWITFIQYSSCRSIIPTPNKQSQHWKEMVFFHRIQSLLRQGDRIEIVGGGLSHYSPSSIYWKTVWVKLSTEISYWSILSLNPMGLSHHTCSFSLRLFFHRNSLNLTTFSSRFCQFLFVCLLWYCFYLSYSKNDILILMWYLRESLQTKIWVFSWRTLIKLHSHDSNKVKRVIQKLN